MKYAKGRLYFLRHIFAEFRLTCNGLFFEQFSINFVHRRHNLQRISANEKNSDIINDELRQFDDDIKGALMLEFSIYSLWILFSLPLYLFDLIVEILC